jgi:hypothetical protein
MFEWNEKKKLPTFKIKKLKINKNKKRRKKREKVTFNWQRERNCFYLPNN